MNFNNIINENLLKENELNKNVKIFNLAIEKGYRGMEISSVVSLNKKYIKKLKNYNEILKSIEKDLNNYNKLLETNNDVKKDIEQNGVLNETRKI